MKTSLRKLRGLALHKHDAKDRRNIRPLAQLDELAQATQDMEDMRDCYDNFLSAAAATTNSAYEFSESLREMGACLLKKTALNDDEESGKVLLMLGKVQFELQELVDNYRSHIFQTITVPSESLLNELRTVEEMKRQCDEKRNVYEYMIARYRERGRSRGGKGESFSWQQVQTACDEYDDEATLFVFRLKSLKQGQSRSLLTQAARHHAAQLCFFKRALKSLETVEPHVKSVTEQQHIDYQFIGLEDDDADEDDDGDYDDEGYDENDDGELSFDYGQNEHENDVSTSRNSMELDEAEVTFPRGSTVEAYKENLDRLRRNSFSFSVRGGSQSAPLFADNRPDSSEKSRQMRPSLSRKFHTYVLPTPVDAKTSTSPGSTSPVPSKAKTSLKEPPKNLWHSSPLEQRKYEKVVGVEKFSGPIVINAQSVLKESNSNTASTRMPPPLVDGVLSPNHDSVAAYSKKIKRLAFSGPLTSKPWPAKPVLAERVQLFSGPLLRTPVPRPSSTSPKVSPSASPTFTSSPKISELHELPKPPAISPIKSSKLLGLVGYSGPLVSRGQVLSGTNRLGTSNAASPLPTPPQAMPRSFSIPSSGARAAALHESKPLEASHIPSLSEQINSPPLTPIALSGNRLSSDGSKTAAQAV
ncbi:hypothetical protein L6164_010780 [Bauhinia variegata]|uniref:Uncharacterized protein n=1 Tax=Bauhinia variegata TaxID=167791 RepID=A0ACB9P4C5_BAUVA|nr:hypothetical protein L6164_010780 [Bauhinia variegata]